MSLLTDRSSTSLFLSVQIIDESHLPSSKHYPLLTEVSVDCLILNLISNFNIICLLTCGLLMPDIWPKNIATVYSF